MKEITVIHGFGAKNYASAIYIDNKLFSSGLNLDDSEHVINLVKKMAKTFSVKWTEFTAPEIFRLESYYDPIPKTISAYEKDAVNLFKNFSTLESVSNSIYYSVHITQEQIENSVEKFYLLSGGLEKNFQDFYEIYETKFPKIESELEKEYIYLNHKHNSYNNDNQKETYKKMNDIQEKLFIQFKEQLQFVWDYPKEMNKFKVLALKNKQIIKKALKS